MKKYLYDTLADRWLKDCDSIWIYSDTHFGEVDSYLMRNFLQVVSEEQYNSMVPEPDISYRDFLKYMAKQADNEQVSAINKKCGKNSCLIHLGDVGDIDAVKKLRARYKILVLGNHDKSASNYKRVITAKKIPCDKYLPMSPNDIYFKSLELFPNDRDAQDKYSEDIYREAHKKALADVKKEPDFKTLPEIVFSDFNAPFEFWEAIYDNELFDEVYEGPITINDRTILSHEPLNVDDTMFNIHGHVHNAIRDGDAHHKNCCAESIDYTPFNLLKAFKTGLLKDIDNIHKKTIHKATERKQVKN